MAHHSCKGVNRERFKRNRPGNKHIAQRGTSPSRRSPVDGDKDEPPNGSLRTPYRALHSHATAWPETKEDPAPLPAAAKPPTESTTGPDHRAPDREPGGHQPATHQLSRSGLLHAPHNLNKEAVSPPTKPGAATPRSPAMAAPHPISGTGRPDIGPTPTTPLYGTPPRATSPNRLPATAEPSDPKSIQL